MEEIKKKIEDEQLEDVTGGAIIRVVRQETASAAKQANGLVLPGELVAGGSLGTASAAVEYDRSGLSKGLTQEGDA